MKSLCVIGTIVLMCSSFLLANQAQVKDYITVDSETLSLPEMLSYVEDTVRQLIDADEQTSHDAFYELEESLKIIYTLNCLYPEQASVILQTLDECYAALADASDRDPDSDVLIQSLLLFSSGRNYEHESFVALTLQEWTNTITSNELKSAMEAADADLIYIQGIVLKNLQDDIPPSRLLYSTCRSQHSTCKILIIKSNDSSEYEIRGGIDFKLGGKDHGKSSVYVEGQVKDKNGNYVKGKVSREKEDDGCQCQVEAGKKKEKKN